MCAGASGVQGHPQSVGEFEASLGCLRPPLKRNKGRMKERERKGEQRRRTREGRKEIGREGGKRKELEGGSNVLSSPAPPCLSVPPSAPGTAGAGKAAASKVLSAPSLVRRTLTRAHWSVSASETRPRASPGDHEKALNFTLTRPSLKIHSCGWFFSETGWFGRP